MVNNICMRNFQTLLQSPNLHVHVYLHAYLCTYIPQSLGIENREGVDSPDNSDVVYQKWVGKDYYNPFIKDFIELNKPHQGILRIMSYHNHTTVGLVCYARLNLCDFLVKSIMRFLFMR